MGGDGSNGNGSTAGLNGGKANHDRDGVTHEFPGFELTGF